MTDETGNTMSLLLGIVVGWLLAWWMAVSIYLISF